MTFSNAPVEEALLNNFCLCADSKTLANCILPGLELYPCHTQEQLLRFCASGIVKTAIFCSASFYRIAAPLLPGSLYFPPQEGQLTKALLYAKLSGYALHHVCVDGFDCVDSRQLLAELGYEQPEEGPLFADPLWQTEQLLAFHRKNISDGRVDLAITTDAQVKSLLQAQGLPVYYPLPSKYALLDFLKMQFSMEALQKNDSRHLVTILIHLSTYSNLEHGMEFFLQENRLNVQKLILNFAKKLDGYTTALSTEDYLLFTTKAFFESETDGYTACPLLKQIEAVMHAPVQMGAGIGLTVQQSALHAQLGLKYAVERDQSNCYVIMENKKLVGPLSYEDVSRQELLRINDPTLEFVSRSLGIPLIPLHKFYEYIRMSGITTFTVKEVAPHIGLSERTTYRLVSQLLTCGYLQISGEDKVNQRGRSAHVLEVVKII